MPITAADSFMREGKPLLGRLALGLFRPRTATPGVCFSGVVERLGVEVEHFKVGDAVLGETLFNQGTQAEYICVPQDDVTAKKPSHISHQAASSICYGHLTSMNFLTQVIQLKADHRILIIGASGSLGTAAVQIAKEIAAHVAAVCSTGNIIQMQELGANEVIDRNSQTTRKLNPLLMLFLTRSERVPSQRAKGS